MTGSSLRRGLLLWLLAGTAVIGLIALADTWAEAKRTARGLSDRVLTGSALAIAERVTADEAGGLEVDIPYSALEMLASTAQDRVFYRVDGPGGLFLTGYDQLEPVLKSGDGIGFADGTFGAVPIRIATLVRQVSTGDGSVAVTVTVAESTLARDALARSILLRSALRLGGMIAGAAAIVWVAVTLALRPLDRLGAAITQRSPDDLRPIGETVPAEVARLVAAINSFMLRLETALAALRNFTGNASHQLRTPLSVVRTQLALAGRSADAAAARDASDKADAALARAERVLAQLLVLAQVDASAATEGFPQIDLARLARDLVAEMVPAALRAGIDLGYEGPDTAHVRAEPILCMEMLRNLLDNAIAYCGQGATVTLRTRAAATVTVEIEDNGPGLPPARIAGLPRTRQGNPAPLVGGHGLGLAIVQEIAVLFAARVDFAARKGGGLIVRISFPPN